MGRLCSGKCSTGQIRASFVFDPTITAKLKTERLSEVVELCQDEEARKIEAQVESIRGLSVLPTVLPPAVPTQSMSSSHSRTFPGSHAEALPALGNSKRFCDLSAWPAAGSKESSFKKTKRVTCLEWVMGQGPAFFCCEGGLLNPGGCVFGKCGLWILSGLRKSSVKAWRTRLAAGFLLCSLNLDLETS